MLLRMWTPFFSLCLRPARTSLNSECQSCLVVSVDHRARKSEYKIRIWIRRRTYYSCDSNISDTDFISKGRQAPHRAMDSDLDNSLNYDGNSDIIYEEDVEDGSELRLNADADIDHGEDIHDTTTEDDTEDQELQNIKARVREMEEEAEKLKQLQSEAEQQMNVGFGLSPTAGGSLSVEEKMEVDARSVYVGNVDYGATAEELEAHFHGSGSINRVTILCNKFDGHPKGYAYVEFADKESVNASLAFDESLFRGRLIKVMPKRTNRPGLSVRPPRGGRGGGGGFRPPYRGRGSFRGNFGRFPRRGYRGRGSFYSPY